MTENGKEVAAAKPDALGTVRGMLEKMKAQFQLALPRHITPERMMRVALTTVQKTPKLLECHPITLMGALMQCAQLGLEPDGITNQAHLVPFMNRKKGRLEVQFIPGYKGLMMLAVRSGEVSRIIPRAAYAKDHFIYEFGINEKLEHRPVPEGERGELDYVYAIAYMRDATKTFDVMSRGDVEAIRERSKAAEDGPWVTDFNAMALKTVIRRLCKYLPMASEKAVDLAKAVALDERAEAGLAQDLGMLAAEDEAPTDSEVKDAAQMPARASEKKVEAATK